MQQLARQVQRPGDQPQDDRPPDEPGWWFITDGKAVWWLASDGRWYPPTHEGAPPPPESLRNPDGSGFGLAALAIGIVVTLAGLIPLLLFIGWALTPT
jgi:hypothetical protein